MWGQQLETVNDESWITRAELYDLVWDTPLKKLAADFGISDVRLGKVCRQLEIPLPGRGHWTKRAAGKEIKRPPLPSRPSGMRNDAALRRREPTTLDPDLPPSPTFPSDLHLRRRRFQALVGEVVVGAERMHRSIGKLRREYQRPTRTWHDPYDTPFLNSTEGLRRARIASALLFAIERGGASTSVVDKEATEFEAKIDGQVVRFEIDCPQRGSSFEPGEVKHLLTVRLRDNDGRARRTWSEKGSSLEEQLRDVAVAILVSGETRRRESVREAYARAILEIELLRKEERRRTERQLKANEDKLFSDAAAHRQATEIRQLVVAVRAAEFPSAELDEWCRWGLGVADRLDPVRAGTAMNAAPDPFESTPSWLDHGAVELRPNIGK